MYSNKLIIHGKYVWVDIAHAYKIFWPLERRPLWNALWRHKHTQGTGTSQQKLFLKTENKVYRKNWKKNWDT